MPAAARLYDIWSGVCVCHNPPIAMSGPIITASGDTNTNADGRGQARLLDTTIGGCGHTGIIITGSSNVICNGRGVARLGDSVTGCNVGTIVTASPNVNAGG